MVLLFSNLWLIILTISIFFIVIQIETENQKSEQAKLVERALLEQVMNGKIDVLDLLKSGESGNAKIKEKIQQQSNYFLFKVDLIIALNKLKYYSLL